ncbi:unnamed protein product, partial [Laminaria digitata]
TLETPVALDDEEVLVRRGLLRRIQEEQPDVNFHYVRDRRVVLVRGRKERTEWSAALLQASLYGGGLDANGVANLSVSLVPLAPSGMNLMMDRGRLHLRRLSMETGTDMDAVPASSVIRVRARSASTVAFAKRVLLSFVGDHKAEIFLDLARISAPSGNGGNGDARKSVEAAVGGVERNEPRGVV